MFGNTETFEFDPSDELGRLDVDIGRWAYFHGIWRKSDLAPAGKNAWKMDPNRDLTALAFHFTRGYPTPPSHIARCQCIAQRNARELAEQLGYADFQGSWPTAGDTVFLPKPNHTDEDAVIHVDDLPVGGMAASLPEGEVGHVIQQPAKPHIGSGFGEAPIRSPPSLLQRCEAPNEPAKADAPHDVEDHEPAKADAMVEEPQETPEPAVPLLPPWQKVRSRRKRRWQRSAQQWKGTPAHVEAEALNPEAEDILQGTPLEVYRMLYGELPSSVQPQAPEVEHSSQGYADQNDDDAGTSAASTPEGVDSSINVESAVDGARISS